MAEQGLMEQPPGGPTPATVEGDPTEDQMIRIGAAAQIIGVDPRTTERWVDNRKLRGGRARDPITGEPISGSWRWVDVRHAVALAVGANRGHLVPQQWQHLIPRQPTGSQPTE